MAEQERIAALEQLAAAARAVCEAEAFAARHKAQEEDRQKIGARHCAARQPAPALSTCVHKWRNCAASAYSLDW